MHTFDTLDKLPQRCSAVLANPGSPLRFDNLVLVASGDAAIAADLFLAVVQPTSTAPIIVTRDRRLPAFVGQSTLVVALSETGSDGVTVDAVAHATDLGAAVAVVAPGGHLLDMAAAQAYIVWPVPKPIVARTPLLGELFFGLWGLLTGSPALASTAQADAKAAVDLLSRQRKLFGPEAAEDGNPARLLTTAFHARQPLLYGASEVAQGAAQVWVDRLRSTGHPAYAGRLDVDADPDRWPAMTSTRGPHGEALVLRDVDEPADVDASIAALRKALGSTVTVNELSMDGRSPLERLWGAIYLAEWTAFYLAP